MRLKKQSMREMRDAAMRERAAGRETGDTVKATGTRGSVPGNTAAPVEFFRGARVKRAP
jgi:hypothetical protein